VQLAAISQISLGQPAFLAALADAEPKVPKEMSLVKVHA
jgi:hypothetical protein